MSLLSDFFLLTCQNLTELSKISVATVIYQLINVTVKIYRLFNCTKYKEFGRFLLIYLFN